MLSCCYEGTNKSIFLLPTVTFWQRPRTSSYCAEVEPQMGWELDAWRVPQSVCASVTQAPRGTLQLNWRMPRSNSRERLRPLPQRCRRSNGGISMKRGKRWNRCSQKTVGEVLWAYVREVNKFEKPVKVWYAITVLLMYRSLRVIQSRRRRERQTRPASAPLSSPLWINRQVLPRHLCHMGLLMGTHRFCTTATLSIQFQPKMCGHECYVLIYVM